MSRIRPPENIEIASLKRKQSTVVDYMKAGNGTPWEDRGTKGAIGSFFSTCTMSMFSPAKLTALIRRPETTTDARGFLFGICGIWAISGIMHFAWFAFKETKDPNFIQINQPQISVLAGLTLALCGGGAFILFKIFITIYGKLTGQEKNANLPDVLIYNVSAYAMGPSLVALIPLVGPFIAAVWIFASMIAVGQHRLGLKPAAAIIDSLISLAAVMAIVIGFYYIVERGLNDHLVGYTAVEIRDAKAPPSDANSPNAKP